MSSVFVDFTPSTVGPFTFQPVIGGVTYNATITWNLFGQRFYLNLYDQGGNLILCTALVASGPRIPATFVWNSPQTATATTLTPHNVPLGQIAQVRMSETDSGFDGSVQALGTGPNTLDYTIANPNVAQPAVGIVDFALNLVASLQIGWLLYHWELQQFEFASS
jgi:hypothetical protein